MRESIIESLSILQAAKIIFINFHIIVPEKKSIEFILNRTDRVIRIKLTNPFTSTEGPGARLKAFAI